MSLSGKAEYQWGHSDIGKSLIRRQSFGAERKAREVGSERRQGLSFSVLSAVFQHALLTLSLQILSLGLGLVLYSREHFIGNHLTNKTFILLNHKFYWWNPKESLLHVIKCTCFPPQRQLLVLALPGGERWTASMRTHSLKALLHREERERRAMIRPGLYTEW